MSEPTLYNKETIDTLPWPDTSWSKNVQKLILPMVKQATDMFIENAKTSMQVLLIDDLVLPITICEPVEHNSYVCSIYGHYVAYALDSVEKFHNPLLRATLQGFIQLFGMYLSTCNIDKTVYVNNWLLPTNLYPKISSTQIDQITESLKKKYPHHAIAFRSINSVTTEHILNYFKKSHYSLVPSRIIYFTDTTDPEPFKSRMFKSDLKVVSSSTYKVVDEVNNLEKHLPRMKELYTTLNIDKYSRCNPQLNERYIQLALKTRFISFKAFEKEGRIDAVFGYLTHDQVMTSPFYGYDLSKPIEDGLYRIISTNLLLEAKEKKMLLHQSSGAGHYKKLRRAKAYEEYTAVTHQHLEFKRRLCWKLLEVLMTTIGIRVMKKLQ